MERLVAIRRSLAATALLALLAGCGAMTARSITSLFRPKTSWQKTMESMDGIPFHGPVFTATDKIPTLEYRRIEPKHPKKFVRRGWFHELVVAAHPDPGEIVSDERQLAASLKWLEEEFGLPTNCEFHRGLLADHNGVSPTQVDLVGYFHGICVPSRAILQLDGEKVVGASVLLNSVFETDGSGKAVVKVDAARKELARWLQEQGGETPTSAAARLMSVKACRLAYSRPLTLFSQGGAKLLIPVWECDMQSAVQVNAYTGVAFQAVEPE